MTKQRIGGYIRPSTHEALKATSEATLLSISSLMDLAIAEYCQRVSTGQATVKATEQPAAPAPTEKTPFDLDFEDCYD